MPRLFTYPNKLFCVVNYVPRTARINMGLAGHFAGNYLMGVQNDISFSLFGVSMSFNGEVSYSVGLSPAGTNYVSVFLPTDSSTILELNGIMFYPSVLERNSFRGQIQRIPSFSEFVQTRIKRNFTDMPNMTAQVAIFELSGSSLLKGFIQQVTFSYANPQSQIPAIGVSFSIILPNKTV